MASFVKFDKFAAGIAFRITTGSADNDGNVVTAGDVVVNIDYA